MTRSRDDFRVATSFFQHPKTRKLRRELGPAGVLALIELWAWAASDGRTDGSLAGLSDEEIELAAGWDGEDGVLMMALEELRLIDGKFSERSIHDWAEEQPWIAGREERFRQAREAGRAGGRRSVEVRRERLGTAQPPGGKQVSADRSGIEAVASKRSKRNRSGSEAESNLTPLLSLASPLRSEAEVSSLRSDTRAGRAAENLEEIHEQTQLETPANPDLPRSLFQAATARSQVGMTSESSEEENRTAALPGAFPGKARSRPSKGTRKPEQVLREDFPELAALAGVPEAWEEWCAYRSSKHKPVSAFGARKRLGTIAAEGWGASRFRAAVDASIAMDYQGLFEGKNGNGRHHVPAHTPSDDLAVYGEPPDLG